MATVVNELTIEPKAAPPPETAPGAAAATGGGGGKARPEMEREIEKLQRRERERSMRLWAH